MPLQYLPNQLNNPSLVVNNCIYNKYKINKDGSITWRCNQYFSHIKCRSIVRTAHNEIIGQGKPHVTHPDHLPYEEDQKVFKEAIAMMKNKMNDIIGKRVRPFKVNKFNVPSKLASNII
jgi:hypothetical protein